MLKRRTIAMLVAGTLVGAQAGIAANEQEITVADTYYLVPTEQVVVVEPTDQWIFMTPTLSEADGIVWGPESDYVVVEQTFPVYIAANEPARDMSREARDMRTDARNPRMESRADRMAATRHTPIEMTFKGHPANTSETAGLSFPAGSQQIAQQPSRDYRSSGAFPMNVSESAGTSAQVIESYRLSQSPSEYQVVVITPVTYVAIVE